MRRGRAALGQHLERLTEAYLAGVVPLAEYERRRRDIDDRLLALDRQEQDLMRDGQRQDETGRLAAHAKTFCRRVQEGLIAADFERKRALLELLVDRVIVTDGAVEIRYVVPTGRRGNTHRFRDCEQTIEADISRWKRVIGDGLRSLTDGRQATEVAIAADVLNRMLELGRPEYIRSA
jgi:hypothetical protein